MNVKKIFDHRRLHTKQSFTIFSLLLITLLLFSPLTPLFNTVYPFASAADADTALRAVNGRILDKDKAGDTSDWIEIAKYNQYSLIVHKNFINIYSASTDYSNMPLWQNCPYGPNNNYATTTASGCIVRNNINAWFSGTASGVYADRLAADAMLRDYVVGNNALVACGTVASGEAMTNGLSYPDPNSTQDRDFAFALSYSEAANFFSKTHDIRVGIGYDPEVQISDSPAPENFINSQIDKLIHAREAK